MNPNSIASGKIKLAVSRLASTLPLHAGILDQWHIDEDASVDTMGVGFRDGGLRLVYNPAFVEAITLDELMGVLHHEANHVLFEHVFHEPTPTEDRSTRTIAEEITVNEWVGEPLPGAPVTLSQYPFLPKNEDTDTRYGKLRKRAGKANSRPRGGGNGPGSSSDTHSPEADSAPRQAGATGKTKRGEAKAKNREAWADAKGRPSATGRSDGTEPGQDDGHASPAAAKSQGGKTPQPSSNGVPTVDNHDTWAEIVEKGSEAKCAAKTDSALAWAALGARERKKVQAPFQAIAEGVADETGLEPGLGIGTEPGDAKSSIENGSAKVPWQVVLRRHVGRIRERRPVFGRAPRRFPDMVGILPGKGRFSQKPKILAVIDTSGSMSDPMLSDISAELGMMAKHFEVHVVECDTAVHAVYPYRPIKSVRGRGGTDFRPPLRRAFLKEHDPDLVIYFTDGYGDAPQQEPHVPVIWCITEGGRKPADWGREIRLEEPKSGS